MNPIVNKALDSHHEAEVASMVHPTDFWITTPQGVRRAQTGLFVCGPFAARSGILDDILKLNRKLCPMVSDKSDSRHIRIVCSTANNAHSLLDSSG